MRRFTFSLRLAATTFALSVAQGAVDIAQEPAPDAPVKVISTDDYAKAMKELRTLDGELRNNIEEIARADLERMLLFDATMNARRQAARIEELLGAVQGFWETNKNQSAASFARNAAMEAGNVSKALAVIDLQSPSVATIAQERLDKICTSCHAAHREQLPDGRYRMKS